MKLLIADDHPQITDILGSYAKKEGYETRIAANGQQALALFASFAPDVVLLDVMMPVMDGFEVCRRIRETSDTPVIMVTARGEDFERMITS
jgi:DNA-binding response OmpR family regulator